MLNNLKTKWRAFTKRPLTPHEAIQVALNSDYYDTDYGMCLALLDAQRAGVLTEREVTNATMQIKQVLRGKYIYLAYWLEDNNMPHSSKDIIEFYQNWSINHAKFANVSL